ncbi:hypothetical protein [Calothrix sp. CCY 0018]|uniref:hypothetical protein n=1 Tax=Calothrix sp. CCY 0018 TaxID=3103864 RepID=UPI0039C61347
MTILSVLMSNNPFSYILGFGLLGMILGINLWVNSTMESFQKPKQSKQPKTAQEYVERGYEVMNEIPPLQQNDNAQHQANCKNAEQSFQKAISLDSKIALGYQGQGMSLICQKNLVNGKKSLRRAKTLYLQQGKKREAKNIDLILKFINK